MIKKSHYIIGPIIALAIGLLLGYSAGEYQYRLSSDNSSADKETLVNTFSLMIDYGDGKISNFETVPFIEGETLFSALQRQLKEKNITFIFKEYTGLGSLVTRIGDKENGRDDRYWQYWVNGKYALLGADVYVIKSGDVIEWKFTKSQE